MTLLKCKRIVSQWGIVIFKFYLKKKSFSLFELVFDALFWIIHSSFWISPKYWKNSQGNFYISLTHLQSSGGHISPIKEDFWPKMVPFFMLFVVDLNGYGFKYYFIIYCVILHMIFIFHTFHIPLRKFIGVFSNFPWHTKLV